MKQQQLLTESLASVTMYISEMKLIPFCYHAVIHASPHNTQSVLLLHPRARMMNKQFGQAVYGRNLCHRLLRSWDKLESATLRLHPFGLALWSTWWLRAAQRTSANLNGDLIYTPTSISHATSDYLSWHNLHHWGNRKDINMVLVGLVGPKVTKTNPDLSQRCSHNWELCLNIEMIGIAK